MHGLRVADASVDLLFERVAQRDGSLALTDIHIDGDLEVVLEFSPAHDDAIASAPPGRDAHVSG